MDLILWRHAEAADAAPGEDDLARELTRRGEKQAARVAAWLARQLPEDTHVIASPARRCQQTARALERRHATSEALAPGASVQDLLQAAGWPSAGRAVLVVGHQPVLGETVAQLLGMRAGSCPVHKGGVWWLRSRERGRGAEVLVLAVQSPETL